MSIGIIASLILSLLVVWYVLSPIFEGGGFNFGAAEQPATVGPLRDAKERALRALKDLELDFAMGKISQEDFTNSKGSMTAEIASILAEIKKQGGEA